ncbi:phasin family protein [Nitrincola sp. MINF-07-Sa-05]|uniref:phasin family protein n=1 Tax=Nitrincola salilacus TaxID=3400273 RepID=UPI0039180E8A
MTDPIKDFQEALKPVTEMSENLLKDMEEKFQPVKEKMQPALDMAEINKTAAERLIALQTEYVSDFVNSSLAQLKALTEVREPQDALKLQVEFFKTLDAKFTDVAEKELAVLSGAKDQLTDLIEKSFAELGDAPFLSELSKMDIGKFDMSKFDMTNFIPGAEAKKPAAAKPATARKAAPVKSTPAA